MERLFVLRFGLRFHNEQPKCCSDYFLCKKCTTYVAFREHLRSISWGPGIRYGLFVQVVNVREDEPANYLEAESQTLSLIYCVECGYPLGYRVVEAASGQTHAGNETVNLHIDKVLRRRGNELLGGDALLQEIIENEIVAERIYEHEGDRTATVRHINTS